MRSPSLSAGARGLLAGALAGAWVALGDYGASWLWLPVARDRFWLLVRMLAALVPVGAVLGALIAALATFVWARVIRYGASRAAASWALPFALASVPAAHWLATMLCSGGKMSRLAQQHPIEAALSIGIPCLLYVGLALLAWFGVRVLYAPERSKWVAIVLLGASSFALGKLNQWLLPNLYDYLHALLALVVWLGAALSVGLAVFGTRRFVARGDRLATSLVAVPLACMLGGIALLNARTLDDNLNVRVAMFDARAPSTRALLIAAEPWLRKLEPARRMAHGTKAARRSGLGGLPISEGAHVLLVTIDALRADHLGAYGYARPVSPQLDAFAKDAVVFERAYAQAPHSSYSLSSLHTSEYLHELVALGAQLPTATLATALRDHGYHSAAFFTDGIFHTEGAKLTALRDSAFGFALFDHTNREAEQQTDRVLTEVDRIKQRGEPPSLLWVHYFDVHEPYQETTFGTGEMDRYDSEILHTDRELARLIAEVDARFEREVVIAISADHGEEFRDHGGVYHGSTLYDEQVRVPLIVRAKELPASRYAAPVESIDIAPTLLTAVGAKVPESMRGRDLRALALGKQKPGPVFSAVLTKRMALDWPYKLIADLRFNLFELYDLSRDPSERRNVANTEPQRLSALRDVAYAWLDSLEPTQKETEAERALHLGRLGDRRAVTPACALLLDRSAPTDQRTEAGQVLAKLADPSSVPALLDGLHTEPPAVAAEAAIALGRLYDERAKPALLGLMHTEDPHLRARAAVSLGRLRDPAAVPALIDALWVAPTQYEREEAVRWLGRIRDPRAVEPLLSLLPEFGLRYLLAVALGLIGDARAYPALVEMMQWESRTNIRDEVVRGLGLLGDPRAVPLLVRALDDEPGLKNTAESLVRLGALESGALGGADVAPKLPGAAGLTACQSGPLLHDWDYLARTRCRTSSAQATLPLMLPASRSSWTRGALLVVRARRADRADATDCGMNIGTHALAPLHVDAEYRDQRFELEPAWLEAGSVPLHIVCGDPAARIELDHALVVPHADRTRSASLEAAHDAQRVSD